MPYSSGVYTLPSNSFAVPVTGTTISSTAAASTFADFVTAFSTAVLKDGTQTITANIPMSSFKFTGLTDGSALTDSAIIRQVQYGFGSFLTSVAGTNTITATATPTPAYTVGQRFTFVPAVTNTGAVTLNISSVGAGAVQLLGAALTGGELQASLPVTVYVSAATPVFEIIQPTQFTDARALVVGATDATKKARFEVDGLTTSTTRVVTVPDRNVTIGPTLGTPVATTSGTSVSFTGIPAGVRRVTMSFVGMSQDGSNGLQIQIGPVAGVETSGYLSSAGQGTTFANFTASFGIVNSGAATSVYEGTITLTLENSSSNTWTESGMLGLSNAALVYISAGSKSIAGALSVVKLMFNGADNFDAGEVNISYE